MYGDLDFFSFLCGLHTDLELQKIQTRHPHLPLKGVTHCATELLLTKFQDILKILKENNYFDE